MRIRITPWGGIGIVSAFWIIFCELKSGEYQFMLCLAAVWYVDAARRKGRWGGKMWITAQTIQNAWWCISSVIFFKHLKIVI